MSENAAHMNGTPAPEPVEPDKAQTLSSVPAPDAVPEGDASASAEPAHAAEPAHVAEPAHAPSPADVADPALADPDTTGPLPTPELAEQHARGAEQATEEATSVIPAQPADDLEDADDTTIIPQEPKRAPGWETIPVAMRQDSDAFAGNNGLLSWGSRTDVGLVRGHNEDAMLVDAPLFCVCDGMGGHAAGEVASSIAVQTISEEAPTTADDILLGVAVEKANAAVIQAAEDGRGKPGMGCTATAVLIDGSRMAVAHVGDSRVYVLHAGTLVRITHDHSYVEELVDAGEITVGEARLHPSRSIITRALGSDPNMYADHFTIDVEAGDRIIICSDGLSSMISDAHIEAVAVSSVTPQGAADSLLADALAEGGHDNVSVIVVDVLDDGIVREHRRKMKRRTIVWAMALLAVVAAFAVVGALFVNSSYYLGNNHGNVAIYQGIKGSFMGVRLSHMVESTDVEVADLPDALQGQIVDGISVDSLAEAESTVSSYREQIASDQEKAAKTANEATGSATSPSAATSPGTATSAGSGASSKVVVWHA